MEENQPEILLRIGEIAAFHGVSVRAMRLYEAKGLIRPRKIDPETGYRYYAPGQVRDIQALMELQHLGFSLREIRSILSGRIDTREFVDRLTRKQAAWEEAIAAARHRIDCIGAMIRKLTGSPEPPLLERLSEDQRARLLTALICVEGTRSEDMLNQALWL